MNYKYIRLFIFRYGVDLTAICTRILNITMTLYDIAGIICI